MPIGRASDRLGRRPFIVAGFVILVPSVFAQGIVTGPWLMLLARSFRSSPLRWCCPVARSCRCLAGARGSGTTLSVLTMAFGLGVLLGRWRRACCTTLGRQSAVHRGCRARVRGLVLSYTQVEETLDLGQESDQPAPQD